MTQIGYKFKILHFKGHNLKTKKISYRLEETFSKIVSDKGLVSRIYKELLQFTSKTNDLIKTGEKILI